MKLPSILPPSDLLEQVEGIEEGLRRGQRLGRLGQIGLLLSALQAVVVIANSDWWASLREFKWSQLLEQWPLLLALFIFILSLYLVSWTRFWLKESSEPFRYTYSIATFEAVGPAAKDSSGDGTWDWLPQWLQYDLSRQLDERIGRLSLLDEKYLEGEAAQKPLSHVHISGAYLIRQKPDTRWVIEVTPRVRIGPPGSPETLAHTVRYEPIQPLQSGPSENIPVESEDQAGKPPGGLNPREYRQLLERVYFSVASQIYKQIRLDVQRKIDLLPTRRFRAAAYFYEAEDYARSNTLDAYDEARKLFAESIQRYDPRRIPLSESRMVRFLQRIRRTWINLVRRLTSRLASVSPQMGEAEIMAARAELGYANMLLYRRVLASLSGRRINPVYEALPIALRAVGRLRALPGNLPGLRDSLFDGYVTLALAWYYLDDAEQARTSLDEARRLIPGRAEEDSRYLFADGEVEARQRSELSLFQRAVELDPKFEIAQFQLAYTTEMLWRIRPTLEESIAGSVFEEYERVLEINPGNMGTWSNLGYIHWLLGDPETRPGHIEKSRAAFQNGREYKEIQRETFVAEIDYGLTRISAEKGQFDEAYRHFSSAYSAQISLGFTHGGGLARYYFAFIGEPMFQRVQLYKDRVEAYWDTYHEENPPRYPLRVINNVLAFVLNDYGEACYQYYLHNGNEHWIDEGREAFRRAIELNPNYVLPHYNLYSLVRYNDLDEAKDQIEKVDQLAPNWPDGSFALAETLVSWAQNTKQRLPDIHRDATGLREGAQSKISQAQGYRAQASGPSQAAPSAQQPIMGQSQGGPGTGSGDPELQARKLEKEAAEDIEKATDLENQAKGLEKALPEAPHTAEDRLRTLLPHKWLWKVDAKSGDWQLDWEVLDREDYAEELKWQRELDDLHVQALFTWAKNLRQRGDPEQLKRAQRLFAHIRKYFWPNNWDLLGELLEMYPEDADLKARICATIRRWRVEEPQAYWPVSWLTHRAFNEEERNDIMEAATQQPGLSGHTYKWIGDQWIGSKEARRAFVAYRSARETTDPGLLVEIARKLEDNNNLPDCLIALRRAQQVDSSQAEENQGNPRYSEDYYHYQIGRVFWKLEEYSDAIAELNAIQDTGSDLPQDWRFEFVRDLMSNELVKSPQDYRLLKDWLASAREGCGKETDKKVYRATSHLVREKYRELARPAGGYLTAVYPSITPIAVEADEHLFPTEENWWENHDLFKVFIPDMRQRIQAKMGVAVPGVRIRSKQATSPGDYALMIYDVPRAWGSVVPGQWYFPYPPAELPALKPGAPQPQPALNPLTGDPQGGVWVDPSQLQVEGGGTREHWELFRYMIYHLETMLSSHLAELLDLQRLNNMLEEWQSQEEAEDRKRLLSSALPGEQTRIVLLQVLRGLLRENVPVVKLGNILESFTQTYPDRPYITDLVEAARLSLRDALPGIADARQLLLLSPEFEGAVAAGLRQSRSGLFLALDPVETQDLLKRLDDALGDREREVALVVRTANLRPYVQRLVAINHPPLAVVAERELEEGQMLLVSEQVE